jgi:hypothetical protein
MIDAMLLAGEDFDQQDLDTLILAGQMAEAADHREAHRE